MLELPDLPYAHGALEPFISSDTMALHHGKHHRKYVEESNAWIERMRRSGEIDLTGLSAEEVVAQYPNRFNQNDAHAFPGDFVHNFGQHLNHNVFWRSMSERRDTAPDPYVTSAIIMYFGGMDPLRDAFIQAGLSQELPGWIWLCMVPGQGLRIASTTLGWHPLFDGVVPLLACDIWEHAYYLDYQNRRADFVNAVIDKLLNWQFAEKNLAG